MKIKAREWLQKVKDLFSPNSHRIGDIKIRKVKEDQDTTFEATISHRGSLITISSQDLEALKETLISLKKVTLSNEEVMSRLSGMDLLYLCSFLELGLDTAIFKEEGHQNLLFLGLVKPLWQHNEWHVQLTGQGKKICDYLFKEDLGHKNLDPSHLYAYLWRPLVYRKIHKNPFETASEYKKCSLFITNDKGPDWDAIDKYLFHKGEKCPGYLDIRCWHFNERRIRTNLLFKSQLEITKD